ncbi:Fur family transcriptional regulator [Saccharopolyspora hordei]|uniref:Fur family ferric uptake transcriptional regulator n=1 Tax=Saccharopolyspora hordei TaxID=1838 RepID=A0A853ADA6_9PSEU|nr:Fur family transcriptional regulator [Saccharopolyspora hordei]NYI81806.1 Fur family ferric uptake transcriptional regulator [Saccharopolyspora hordei]
MTLRASTGTGSAGARDPQERLRAAGLRVTKPRLAVLRWLADHPHATADQVATAVRRELGSVSTQAVYDVLNACSSAGLLRRIEPAGHPARFEARIADNHHHLVCRRCGRTEDVDCVLGAAPCLTPSTTAGYAVDEAEVVFWGYCPDCLSQAARPGDHHNDHHEEGRS